jgi:hypothetical protein
MASGLLNSSRQVGGAVGLGVLVTVAGSATATAGGPGPAGLVHGFSAAYWVAAGLLAAASPATAVLHGNPPRPANTPPAEEISKNSGDSVESSVSRSTQG